MSAVAAVPPSSSSSSTFSASRLDPPLLSPLLPVPPVRLFDMSTIEERERGDRRWTDAEVFSPFSSRGKKGGIVGRKEEEEEEEDAGF